MNGSDESKDLRAKYGKGFEIIKKLGFTGGGLGVDGSGISEPIQVKIRPTNLGIMSESDIPSNKYEKSLNLSIETKNFQEKSKKQKTGINHEKQVTHFTETKTIQAFPKKAYLDDIMETISSQREICVQKRKTLQECLDNKLFEIENQSQTLDNLKEKKLIMENLRAITKQIQRIFLKFQFDLEKIMEDEITDLFQDQITLSTNDNEDFQDQMDSLEKLVDEFSLNFNDIINSCTDSSSREVSKSYLPYCSMIKDTLRITLQKIYKKERDMKLDPDFGISTWISIKALFVSLQTTRKEKDYDSKLCFEQLMLETLGKYLEVYFMCSWDPIKENEYGISLLNIWMNLIPSEFIMNNLLQVIWNKQIHQIQLNNIKFKSDQASEKSSYKWLFQWFPYYYKFGMGYQVSKVISKYINGALDEWEPPEEWPLSLLNIWKPILETQKDHDLENSDNIELFGNETHYDDLLKQELDGIILSRIYPKLNSYFNLYLIIEQNHEIQQLDCFDHLELWFINDLIDKSLVSQIFTQVIGPKWSKALELKLSKIRNEYNYIQNYNNGAKQLTFNEQLISLYKDLLEWYQFWRQIFSKGAMASAKSKAFLARGLIYMDYHINFYSDLDPEIKKKSVDWIDYESFKNDDEEIPELQNFKDDTLILNVLEWVSDETGLVIKQSERKNTHGRQIYSIEYGEYNKESKKSQSNYFKLNQIQIKLFFYINQGVIFIWNHESQKDSDQFQDWIPVSIPKMLAKLGIEQLNN